MSGGGPVERAVGAAGGGLPTRPTVLDIGAHHPAAHGAVRLAVTLDGSRIQSATPLVGYMHRGAEKLFEVRDYRQIIMLANRHDWLSAFANELGVVLAVERMLGLAVPARAVWIRTLLAELNRVLSHLAFLGTFPPDSGLPATLPAAFEARERLQALLESVSGGRLHYMFNRVGGVKEDLPAGWLAAARATVADTRGALDRVAAATVDAATFRDRAAGIGRLDAATAESFGVSGPIARAAGLDFDLRRDEPYLGYGELSVPVVLRATGDCLARYECLVEQCRVSLQLADDCLTRLADVGGPVCARLPKVVRAPEGEAYAWTENPLGLNGYYLVSRGEPTPWRLKLRSASFNNVQALPVVLAGCELADLTLVLASFFFVVGDVDK